MKHLISKSQWYQAGNDSIFKSRLLFESIKLTHHVGLRVTQFHMACFEKDQFPLLPHHNPCFIFPEIATLLLNFRLSH